MNTTPNFPKKTLSGFGKYLKSNAFLMRPEKSSGLKTAIVTSVKSNLPIIPQGYGKSYGDAFLNSDGLVLSTKKLNKFLEADWEKGQLKLESGVTFREIFSISLDKSWLPPVTPGYSEISIGGAISFDIHGKNHGRKGGFGKYVVSFTLLTPKLDKIICSRTCNSELFYATIGGMGLTGIIEDAVIQLEPIPGNTLLTTYTPLKSFGAIFKHAMQGLESDYFVIWIDLLNSRDTSTLRGISQASKFTNDKDKIWTDNWSSKKSPPLGLISPFYNKLSNKLFNSFYYHRGKQKNIQKEKSLRSFLFPWDTLSTWNDLYGSRGFIEYQAAIPSENARPVLNEIFQVIFKYRKKVPIYFCALKRLMKGVGLLSFGKDGYSILFDAPATKEAFSMFDELDVIVTEANGHVYLAKDGRLSEKSFTNMYSENLDAFSKVRDSIDPEHIFKSDMSRRLGLD